MNVERRLTVECQRNRECLPGRQRPFFMGESQGLPRLVVDRDDKIDATFILRTCRAMRKRAALVVGVCPALPVADTLNSSTSMFLFCSFGQYESTRLMAR
jgi:hypothetical protein